jgi:DNA-binding response OmpR family regulator
MAMKSESWLAYAMTCNFPSLSGGSVILYPESHEAFFAGKNVHLSRTHFRFLTALLSNFCQTVPYCRLIHVEDRILTQGEQNLLKVQMFHLRKLLKRYDAGLEIRNVYGRGYQIRPI